MSSQALYKLVAENISTESGKVLSVCHGFESAAYGELSSQLQADFWYRTAGFDGEPAAWLNYIKPYDIVLLPLPKGKETLKLCLAAAASIIQQNGVVYLFGLNDEGIKSVSTISSDYFSRLDVVAVGAKGRIYKLSSAQAKDYNVNSFKMNSKISLNGRVVELITYAGLFAKGGLDEATALLIENMPLLQPGTRLLDYACGLGIVAKAAEMQQPAINVTLADYDALAVLAARQNLPNATTYCIADPSAVREQYDIIVSNPPIHEGQDVSYRLVGKLIENLPRLLLPGGKAYFVTQITVPVARMAGEARLKTTEIAKNRAFRVTEISAL